MIVEKRRVCSQLTHLLQSFDTSGFKSTLERTSRRDVYWIVTLTVTIDYRDTRDTESKSITHYSINVSLPSSGLKVKGKKGESGSEDEIIHHRDLGSEMEERWHHSPDWGESPVQD